MSDLKIFQKLLSFFSLILGVLGITGALSFLVVSFLFPPIISKKLLLLYFYPCDGCFYQQSSLWVRIFIPTSILGMILGILSLIFAFANKKNKKLAIVGIGVSFLSFLSWSLIDWFIKVV